MANLRNENRRRFLQGSALTAGAMVLNAAGTRTTAFAADCVAPAETDALNRDGSFRSRAFELRGEVARQNKEATAPQLAHPNNGDEARYPAKFASYTKGLQHTDDGEVVPASYTSLIAALNGGKPEQFEAILIGGTKKLVNPRSGLAFEMMG